MRILLWIGQGENQIALANKLSDKYTIVGIVVEKRKTPKKFTIKKIVSKVIEKIFLNSIDKAWFRMLAYYKNKGNSLKNIKTLFVENINSSYVYDFSNECNPDLIIVSGTRLIKEKLLSIQPKIGIINLHTGLSPYVKGGPNCTNWCIATKQFHLIGNTVMWINEGIDSGNILTTELTMLTGNETLSELHIKIMEHAHELLLKAVEYLNAGNYQSVDQIAVAKGKTYYTREWTLRQKINLIVNFKEFSRINSPEYKDKKTMIKVIPLEKK